MSTLFNKLKLSAGPKTWADADFENLLKDPKCCDFWKALGREQATWDAWCAFIERKKLGVDWKPSKSRWFGWVYHHTRAGYPLETLHLSPAVEKQCLQYIAFRTAKVAQETEKIERQEAQRREEWRKLKRNRDALTDPRRVAYVTGTPPDILALIEAGKPLPKDLKTFVVEAPLDTTKAQIEEHYVYEKEETPEEKVIDIIVECTNYGLTYGPEDIQATQESTKKLADCTPIVKEYPVPETTIDEQAKKKAIEIANRKDRYQLEIPPRIYKRSDAKLMKQIADNMPDARHFLRRPESGEPATDSDAPPPVPHFRGRKSK